MNTLWVVLLPKSKMRDQFCVEICVAQISIVAESPRPLKIRSAKSI